MAYRCCVPTSDLQDVLDEAADRLSALRMSAIVRKAFLDEDDPDDLAALAALTLDIARALDPIFHEISYRGGIGSRSRASAHAAIVTMRSRAISISNCATVPNASSLGAAPPIPTTSTAFRRPNSGWACRDEARLQRRPGKRVAGRRSKQ